MWFGLIDADAERRHSESIAGARDAVNEIDGFRSRLHTIRTMVQRNVEQSRDDRKNRYATRGITASQVDLESFATACTSISQSKMKAVQVPEPDPKKGAGNG